MIATAGDKDEVHNLKGHTCTSDFASSHFEQEQTHTQLFVIFHPPSMGGASWDKKFKIFLYARPGCGRVKFGEGQWGAG